MNSEQKLETLRGFRRIERFLRKPSREKAKWFNQKWRELISRIPRPVRLPFGGLFLSRKDALGFNLQTFETRELAFAQRFLQPGMTVLDIGANQGLYTLLASQRVGSQGRVFAFEPSPRERRALRINVFVNRCRNVTIERSALGNEDGEAELYLVEGPETGCNSLRPPVLTEGTSSPVRVSITRLDRWIREHSIERVDFMKLDVEGGELEALKGAPQFLQTRPRPVIMCEMQEVRTSPWGYRPEQIAAYLQNLGFRWFRATEEGSLLTIDNGAFEGNYFAVPDESLPLITASLGSAPSRPQSGPGPAETQMYTVNSESPEFQRLLKDKWYYSIELKPGVFTRGDEHANVILNRELLRRCHLADKEVCDIGTMEGVLPTLAKRQGARSVVALDAVDLTDRIRLVQESYGVSFEYYPRISLSRVKEFLGERAKLSRYWGQKRVEKGFDVVTLCGVLYHVFSPLDLLGLARTLLRPGALLIFETAASCQDGYTLDWVFQGDRWLYPSGTNTWFVTLKLLDHFLRLFKLKTIDCAHLPPEHGVVRVAVAAVAVPEPLALKSEEQWFLPTTKNIDYNEIVDTDWAKGRAEILYSPSDNICHSELGDVVDIFNTIRKRAAIPVDRSKIVLHLTDEE